MDKIYEELNLKEFLFISDFLITIKLSFQIMNFINIIYIFIDFKSPYPINYN